MSEPQAQINEVIKKIIVTGDLSKLTDAEKIEHYNSVCESLGLNPLTQPFAFTLLNGKLQLYARKDATEQLRRIYGVSVKELRHDHKKDLELYVVTAVGQDREGREDASTGAVSVRGLQGDSLANAIMKAETKAKRRLTLSIVGLGMLDETELETIVPERMASVKDGVITVDPASPAQVQKTDTPPEGKKRGRPKKTEPGDNQPWGGVVGQNAVPMVNEPIVGKMPAIAVPEVGPNIHGLVIDDSEVPFPGDDKKPEPPVQKTNSPEDLPNAEEQARYKKTLLWYREKGYTGLREFILKRANTDNASKVSKTVMESVLAELKAADEAGTLKTLLEAK